MLHDNRSRRILPRFLLIVIALMTGVILAAPRLGAAAPGPGLAWTSLDQRLNRVAPAHNLLVAEFSGNHCQPIHAVNADTGLAIASTFKLYVLGELARQIQAGQMRWDETIVLRTDLRSMPSGDYAWVPGGTRVTVRQLAEAMIWHSDNTATDHLIHRLGREQVEKAFAAYGHAHPRKNMPLLLTHELFAIKMRQPEAWMARYMAASDREQLNMITRDIDGVHLNPSGGWGKWNGPTAIAGIEWFASASDLCRAMVGLWTMGAQPGLEPVREILAGNRGGIADTGTWPRVGFKAGYEAGVVNSTYVLQRDDGRVFFVSAGFNSQRATIGSGAASGELTSIIACLGTYRQTGDCGA